MGQGARDLVANVHFQVTFDESARLVRIVRTAVSYASTEEMETSMGEVARELAVVPPGCALILDSRESPMRNDPEFEAAFAKARAPILARFERVAVLVKSAVGKLQVRRYSREAGGEEKVQVFDDEAKALAHATRGTKR
jgi:hypothetical protein